MAFEQKSDLEKSAPQDASVSTGLFAGTEIVQHLMGPLTESAGDFFASPFLKLCRGLFFAQCKNTGGSVFIRGCL